MNKRSRWQILTMMGLLAALSVGGGVSPAAAAASASAGATSVAPEAASTSWTNPYTPLWRDDAYYKIIARNSGGVLDIPNGENAYSGNQVQIGQWPYHGGANQLWRPVLDRFADGVQYYTFHRKGAYSQCLAADHRPSLTWNLVLDGCYSWPTSPFTDPIDDRFLFWPEHQADGWWAWRAKGSNRVWDISWNSVEAGAPVVIYPKSTLTGAWNQQFMLYYVEEAGPKPTPPPSTPPVPPTSPTPPAPTPKPDLAWDGGLTWNEGSKRIEGKIKNQGTANAPGFLVSAKLNYGGQWHEIGPATFYGLAPGGTATVFFYPSALPAGQYSYNFVADYASAVVESNEGNNALNGYLYLNP
ncbi:RICIN domain-containing protein [Micromonospora sp. NPDC000089]|uniref:RICIN domain-containing protein n=1 Tax=unclassified Micromonospora TaxID=2617518 RepID=UPI0036966665